MPQTIKEEKYAHFEILFKTYHSRLYFYALNFIHDEDDAKDIIEDVFGYLWENYDVVVKEVSPLPLLYSWVKSRCVDYIRHCNVTERYREFALQEAEYVDEDDGFAEHHERVEQIMKAIEVLPPQTRRVFKACFLKGKKYKEISQEMNISVNTVKTYIVRALSFIRGQVKADPN